MIEKKIRDFDDLIIYRLAVELAERIYDLTTNFPQEEKYNITCQLRKAVTSIGANIAEGYGRFHYKENIQFCRQAKGSLAETKYLMLFSRKINYIGNDQLNDFLTKYKNLQIKINNYINSIGKTNL